MDGLKVKALVIKETSISESDKLLTLLTDQNDKITAKIRGVRKTNSKLGYLAHTFNYCEFILSERSGHYVITNGEIIDSFYKIREDVDKYYIASVILETLDSCTYGHEEELLNVAIVYLKQLSECSNPLVVLNKYLLTLIDVLGYSLNFDECIMCGKSLQGETKLCLESGGIVCGSCKPKGINVIVKPIYFFDLKNINNISLDKIGQIDIEKERAIEEMNLIIKYLYYQMEVKLSSVLSLRDYFGF